MARVLTSFLATTTGVIWVPPKRTRDRAFGMSGFQPCRPPLSRFNLAHEGPLEHSRLLRKRVACSFHVPR